MNPQPETLVLFDIDGTLVNMCGAGREAFARALKSVFGTDEGLENISFSGATDLIVLESILKQQGVKLTRDKEEQFWRELASHLEQTAQEKEPIIYPGVRELLHTLGAREDVILGLVTGNIEECARIKLERFGLHNHFVLGAFGHEHADRAEIAILARQRALLKLNGEPRASYLIGDTPSDIHAARAIGAKSIAVATGTYSEPDLLAAGADYVLTDLTDTGRICGIMGLH
ncbi:MAG: HAD family hydrolase [Verrucomicrobia bacterium]|nr:HAD family hydrolase [Verrucomicrobiota bacterium]